MKKIIAIILSSLLLLFFTSCDEKEEEREKENIQIVNEAVEKMTTNEAFIEAPFDKKKLAITILLDQMEEKGYVSDFSYNKYSKTFTFTCDDDGIGNVILEDAQINS